jgi:hypothetical protein
MLATKLEQKKRRGGVNKKDSWGNHMMDITPLR